LPYWIKFKRDHLDLITVDKIMEKYPDGPKKYDVDGCGYPSKLANEHLVDF